MKLNFTLDMTPDEFTSLVNAEVEAQRIREGRHNDDFDKKFVETEARIREAHREVDARIAEFQKSFERVSKEIDEAKKAWGQL